MAHGRRFTVAGLLAVLALGVGACGDDDEDAGAPAGGAQPAALSLTATANGERKAMEAPQSVPAGIVQIRLRNNDSVPREAQILRVTGSQTIKDVLKIVQQEGAPTPQFIRDGGGVAPVPPGRTGTVTQVLRPGTHYIFDTGEGEGDDVPSNAELGATARFVVEEGDGGDAQLPEVPGRIAAVDYGFEFDGLKAGTNRVRFANTGRELHHAIMFPIVGDATLADVRKAFSSEEPPKGPPPVDFEKPAGTTVIDGGVEQNIELDLESGRYAAVCFISDRKGGPPHVAKGMLAEVNVP